MCVLSEKKGNKLYHSNPKSVIQQLNHTSLNKLLYEPKYVRFSSNFHNSFANHYLSIIQQQRCNISDGISSTSSNITLAEAKHAKQHDGFTY